MLPGLLRLWAQNRKLTNNLFLFGVKSSALVISLMFHSSKKGLCFAKKIGPAMAMLVLVTGLVRGSDGRIQATWVPVCFGYCIQQASGGLELPRSSLQPCNLKLTMLAVLSWTLMVKARWESWDSCLNLSTYPIPTQENHETALKVLFQRTVSICVSQAPITLQPGQLACVSMSQKKVKWPQSHGDL